MSEAVVDVLVGESAPNVAHAERKMSEIDTHRK
jgi:hypothetical protein